MILKQHSLLLTITPGVFFVVLLLLGSSSQLIGCCLVRSQQTTTEVTTDDECPDGDQKLLTCKAENKTCRVAADDGAYCGPCLEGYIEFGDGNNDDAYYCMAIDDITFENYEAAYQPAYRRTTQQLGDAAAALRRLATLREAARFVSAHNAQLPPPSYLLAINAFSADDAVDEQQRLGYTPLANVSEILNEIIQPVLPVTTTTDEGSSSAAAASSETLSLPVQVDWVEAGAVTSVKDQGRCGCCFAVAVCGAVEGAAAIASNFTYLQSMSFQQIISCNDLNSGCNGGSSAIALVYSTLNRFGGLATLNNYRFSDAKGDTTQECKLQGQELAVDTQGANLVVSSTSLETFEQRLVAMKQAVAKQPVSIAMKSSCRDLSHYRSGILTSDGKCSCSDYTCLDHAVLLVGYNDQGDTPYWKVKNSWGTDWGEDGYFRVAQKNPDPDNLLSRGLFGILSEGIVPIRAFNLTEEVFDEPQTVDELERWAVVLIAIAAGLVVGACCTRVAKMMRRGRNGEEEYLEPASPE